MRWLQRRSQKAADPAAPPAISSPPPRLPVIVTVKDTDRGGTEGLVQLSGTTTFASDALVALAARHDLTDGGYPETAGVLQREPDNAGDPRAVAVLIEGERIGYLPG